MTGVAFDIAALTDQAIGASGEVELAGNVRIRGDIKTNGEVSLEGNVVVAGGVTGSRVGKSGNARIKGLVTETAHVLSAPPIDLDRLAAGLERANDNGRLPPALVRRGVLWATGEQELVLPSGSYLLAGLELSGNARLLSDGDVTLFVDGAVTLSGNVRMDAAPGARWTVLSRSRRTLAFAGNAVFDGIVCAPRAALEAEGNPQITGYLFAETVFLSGNVRLRAS